MMKRNGFLSASVTFSLALVGIALPACDDPDNDPEINPAGFLGDEEMWDEGPIGDEIPAVDELRDDPHPELAPAFQLPFPCNQVWAGQTRTDHSPQLSVDFNRTDDVNDPVVSSAAGTVKRVENLGSTSYGRWIEIDHGGGYRSRYAHLN